MSKRCIIGIGNTFRGDDGFGLAVIDALEQVLDDHTVLIKEGGDMASMLSHFEQYDDVIIVDAMHKTGSVVGDLVWINARTQAMSEETLHTSTHAFSLNQVIELSINLGCLPKQCHILAIQGENFEYNQDLSPEVQNQIQKACKLIISKIQQGNDYARTKSHE